MPPCATHYVVPWDEAQFRSASKGDPRARVFEMTMPSCDGCDRLLVTVARVVDQGDDAVPKDALWRVQLPGGGGGFFVRLWRGEHSMRHFCERVLVFGEDGCPYVQNATERLCELTGVCPRASKPPRRSFETKLTRDKLPRARLPSRVDPKMICVPQPKGRGICWWGAISLVLFGSDALFEMIVERDANLAQGRKGLCSVKTMEAVRKYIFERYGCGDDPNQPGSMDGKNGGEVLRQLLDKLGIPVHFTQVRASKSCPLTFHPEAKARVLLVSYHRQAECKPPERIRDRSKREWRLVGVLIGDFHCMHQVGAVRMSDDVVSYADTDSIREGVGPVFFAPAKASQKSNYTFVDVLNRMVAVLPDERHKLFLPSAVDPHALLKASATVNLTKTPASRDKLKDNNKVMYDAIYVCE